MTYEILPSSSLPLATIALIGNPNTGKSTLFSALAGVHQQVGNYPGVTVEKKTGRMDFAGPHYELIDLPGLYSLAPRSRDEMVAVDLLLGRQSDCRPVDAVICIVDASNLERNLYLRAKCWNSACRRCLAVNMLDVARSRGVTIDLARLEKQLGIPVVGVQANRRMGIADLKVALAKSPCERSLSPQASRGVLAPGNVLSPSDKANEPRAESLFPKTFEEAALRLQNNASGRIHRCPIFSPGDYCSIPAAISNACSRTSFPTKSAIGSRPSGWSRLIEAGCPIPGVETAVRYEWVREKARRGDQHAAAVPANGLRSHRPRADASPLGPAAFRRGDVRRCSNRYSSGRAH